MSQRLRRALALSVASTVALTGCGWLGDADEPGEGAGPPTQGAQRGSELRADDQPPSALVARPAPVTRLGDDAVVASDLERIEELRESLDAEEREDGTLVSLPGDVLFAFDRAEVTDTGRRTLAHVAELVELEDPPAVRVEGHTDSVGDPAYNQELSERRAQAAAAVLTDAHGVDRDLLEVRGFGEDQPVAPNTTDDGEDNPEGRARNRRVEIILVER